MKAISIIPGQPGTALREVDEPVITKPDEVKVKMRLVGICGTDREEVEGGRADAPAGKKHLIIGHEMLGEITEVGEEVSSVIPGDLVVLTVRRGCGECLACLNHRNDLCETGRYTERGIKGAHGFQSEYVVDKERYLIKVPQKLGDLGVLTEPMSVAAKAIDEAVKIQAARLRDIIPAEGWLEGKKALVAGIGAIGLMAAFALRLRGATVIGMDIVGEESLRPSLLKQIGGQYIDGRVVKATDIDEVVGECDFIFEAAGIASLQFELIDALATNGIYVATGIPAGDRPVNIAAAALLRQMVLKNQILLGSVNAGTDHYRMAVDILTASLERWPEVLGAIVTSKVPYAGIETALSGHSDDEIKVVVDWAQ
jgi:threonine dehydrogenase-like Zn-dependent dehydrogenase